jgi:hypothetical protein
MTTVPRRQGKNIITLVFKKNSKFLGQKLYKSQKIVIKPFTPGTNPTLSMGLIEECSKTQVTYLYKVHRETVDASFLNRFSSRRKSLRLANVGA